MTPAGWIGIGWAVIGLLVWAAFAFWGGPRAVPGVRGSSVAFRFWILPSVVLLWPLVAWRWAAWAKIPLPDDAERES